MPPLKPVPTLFDHCTKAVETLVETQMLEVSDYVVKYLFFDENEAAIRDIDETQYLGVIWRRESYIRDQVNAFKDHIQSHLAQAICEHVLDKGVLQGITKAVVRKKKQWTPTTNMAMFGLHLHVISRFADLLVFPGRRSLDLDKLPQLIRAMMYSRLSCMSNLRTLVLGSGSGGWVTEAYSEKFLIGIPSMTRLVHFSLKYDCTISILQVLSEACASTLRILDIERSKYVTDADPQNMEYILRCTKIETLNIFQTGISTIGQATLAFGLPNLTHLERGDYLCDLLEFVDEDGDPTMTEKKLAIKEFWTSEEYFFHTEDQMYKVSHYCPNIQKMLFMFDRGSCRLSALNTFSNLKHLDLWGGEFYTDGIGNLLQIIGQRLTTLTLTHVEEIDDRALVGISLFCPNLLTLGLSSCELVDDIFVDGDEELARRVRESYETLKLMAPFLDLETIKIETECPMRYVEMLLVKCINVKEIFMGMGADINDNTIENILRENRFQKLEKLFIQKSKDLTMQGVEMLITNCDNLRCIKYLEYSGGISQTEIEQLKIRSKDSNWDLELEDESILEHDRANFMRQEFTAAWPPIPEFID